MGVFAKGGHLDKPDDYLLTPEGEGHWLPGERVETQAGAWDRMCALERVSVSARAWSDALTAAMSAKAYVAGALGTRFRLVEVEVRSITYGTIDKVIH